MTEVTKEKTGDGIRRHTFQKWVLRVAAVVAVLFIALVAIVMVTSALYLRIMEEHFPAVVGLPMGALLAFVIVVVLESTSGPIKFKGLGFEFEGASGPVVLWVMCFLAISGAIKLLW